MHVVHALTWWDLVHFRQHVQTGSVCDGFALQRGLVLCPTVREGSAQALTTTMLMKVGKHDTLML